MKTKSKTKLIMFVLLMAVLFMFTGCVKDSNVEKKLVQETGSDDVQTSEDSQYIQNNDESEAEKNPVLYDIIVSNMDEWEYACDELTQRYTYDEVECCQLRLYTGDEKGEYYLSAMYVPTDTGGINTCQRVYYISNGQMNYEYSSILSNDDHLINNYTALYSQSISFGADKIQYVEKLVSEGLSAEEKYYREIALEDKQGIELTDEENKLYQNMYKAILELEYHESDYGVTDDDWYSLVEIGCYVLSDGRCEALLGYGGIWYAETNYISYGDRYVTTYMGYSIDENGYEQLSYDEEKRLRNTNNITTIDWNPDWTTEKKEYVLKEAIHNM